MNGGTPSAGAPKATWQSGAAYERYVGRWSRRVAREFVAWLAASVPAGSRWLEVGSGTGALTQTILDLAAPATVLGVEPSDGFRALAREQVTDPRATFERGEAQALPVDSGAFDATVAGLVLNFVPEPARGVAEFARALRPGGVAAVYVWDYAEGMQFMRYFWETAAALDPAAAALDEGRRFTICNPAGLTALWQGAGLSGVETRAIEIETRFADFDDYWSPFLGGQGPAPTYVAGLSDERRVALREQLRAALPVAADGAVPLVARAWAVRGVR